MSGFALDLRFGIRMLLRNPGFTAVAAAALGLGIGATTAIFSVVKAVLLEPLPYRDPGRLAIVWETNLSRNLARNLVSPSNFLDWQSGNTVFDKLAAVRESRLILTGAGEPEVIKGQAVSATLFPMLGVDAARGRTFLPEEDLAGAARVVVLSHELWLRRFGGDATLLGRALQLSGNAYTVVGVMRPGFRFPVRGAELWVPLALGREPDYRRFLTVAARLKPGVSFGEAQAGMEMLARGLERDHPKFNQGWSATLAPLEEHISGGVQRALYVLLATVGLVLLIACANVANLLLARAAARQREIQIRFALGAGRGRVIRQLLTESLVLALVGGGLGAALANWGTRLLVALAPENLPRVDEIRVDAGVLAFAAALCVATALVFGLVPAWLASQTDARGRLQEGGRGSSTGRRGRVASRVFVVVQVGLSVMLVAGAGLLIRSFARLASVDIGFQPENLLTARITLPVSKYGDTRLFPFFQQLIQRVETLPGVRSASAVSHLPFSVGRAGSFFTIQGRPDPGPDELPLADVRAVHPNYFRTMGIPLVRGRDLGPDDRREAPPALVISQSLARRYWPDEDSLGQSITVRMSGGETGRIVGIVGDSRDQTLEAEPLPTIFYPHSHLAFQYMTVVLKTHGDPLGLARAVAEAVRSQDAEQPVTDVRTMEQVLSASVTRQRFQTSLLSAFAAVALALAAVGVYGLMSLWVSQRVQEIGIRMAVGAQPADVRRLVLRQGLTLAAIGLVLGLAAARALAPALSGLLYGIGPGDPATFAAALVLAAVALLASYLPARRATRVDPGVALRQE